MFNRELFIASFNKSLKALKASEKTTKEQLSVLSRDVLEASIETGDVAYVNNLLFVLSPMNKKTAIMFFHTFSGFAFDGALATGKSKKQWDKAVANAREFLEDPHNNIWTWAERHIEVQKKEFSLDQVTKAFEGFTKKAMNNGLTQKDVLKAIIKSGVDLDTIVALMGECFDVEVQQ